MASNILRKIKKEHLNFEITEPKVQLKDSFITDSKENKCVFNNSQKNEINKNEKNNYESLFSQKEIDELNDIDIDSNVLSNTDSNSKKKIKNIEFSNSFDVDYPENKRTPIQNSIGLNSILKENTSFKKPFLFRESRYFKKQLETDLTNHPIWIYMCNKIPKNPNFQERTIKYLKLQKGLQKVESLEVVALEFEIFDFEAVKITFSDSTDLIKATLPLTMFAYYDQSNYKHEDILNISMEDDKSKFPLISLKKGSGFILQNVSILDFGNEKFLNINLKNIICVITYNIDNSKRKIHLID